MLETLVLLVNFIRTSFYYGLYLSYKTGDLIVNSINTIFKYFVLCLVNFTSFFSVLCESLTIFFQDIFQFIQQVVVLVTTTIETIYTSIVTVFIKVSLFISNVIALISTLYNGVINGITAIVTSIGYIFIVLRNLVILFGAGVWFLITLLPLVLYYPCKLCITFIHSMYQEICDICYSGVSNVKTLIRDFVLFITDVPIESIAGIVIAFSLAYIFSQFYILFISYFKQQLRKFRNWLRRQRLKVNEIVSIYFSTLTRQEPRELHVPIPRARRPVRQPVLPVQQHVQTGIPIRNTMKVQETRENSDDKYCVICQERNKCVLLLPCRHLCLCSECTRELQYYNEVCPICRTNIESTMKIFI